VSKVSGIVGKGVVVWVRGVVVVVDEEGLICLGRHT
jgi:hypothetical protein